MSKQDTPSWVWVARERTIGTLTVLLVASSVIDGFGVVSLARGHRPFATWAAVVVTSLLALVSLAGIIWTLRRYRE